MARISIELRLNSILKKFGREKGLGDNFALSVEEGTTLDQAREEVGIPPKWVGRFLKDGQPLRPEYKVAAGDVIEVLPPAISGG